MGVTNGKNGELVWVKLKITGSIIYSFMCLLCCVVLCFGEPPLHLLISSLLVWNFSHESKILQVFTQNIINLLMLGRRNGGPVCGACSVLQLYCPCIIYKLDFFTLNPFFSLILFFHLNFSLFSKYTLFYVWC